MAVIKPFRAVRYNNTLLKNVEGLVAPPYDVISEEMKELFYDLSPYNVVRLILGKEFADDSDDNNQYTRARDFISLWLKKGVLVPDEADSIYGYSQTFTAPSGDSVTRSGFVALVRLSPWGEGGIFPHERTNPKPKSDRLTLTKTTGFWLSFIFSLYSDETGETRDLIKRVFDDRELARFKDKEGIEHVLTVCQDEELHGSLAKAFDDKKIFVADGHHRYETALALKDEMGLEDKKIDTLNYAMMYFCPMEGEGIVILPSHRVVTLPEEFDPAGFVEKIGRYFKVEKVSGGGGGGEGVSKFLSSVEGMGKGSFGCSLNGEEYYIFTLLDKSLISGFFPSSMNDLLKDIDMAILRNVMIEGIMGISDPEIVYTKDGGEAIRMAADGRRAAFLINPTDMEDVKTVSLAGERMPQKSTYFYPKVSSGLLLYRLFD
ncbi:MAG: DUF1015 domain-containing protein [Deltaproteobacteria bacterium]|uniref:DUF1015 domain-containing protein n=1 Tax=Candidatus Zymogenus saltonus TaxID=2844893 RepID=A0A9D8PPC9_9DELT|nr:DUF1015 domain-containing protein [Candidatus Zymogenus saltonus]